MKTTDVHKINTPPLNEKQKFQYCFQTACVYLQYLYNVDDIRFCSFDFNFFVIQISHFFAFDTYIYLFQRANQAMPIGIMKLRSSAHSPHAARLDWNITTHVPMPIAHKRAPIADNITSEVKITNILISPFLYGSRASEQLQLTSSNRFLFHVFWLPEGLVEEPYAIDGPKERQKSETN